jgi:hypothetical protein
MMEPVEKEATPHRFSNTKEVRQEVLAMAGLPNTVNPTAKVGSIEYVVESKTLSLAQKILDLQNKVGIVKKKGRNREHNYDFLRIEDAVVAVNKLLSEMRLILTPELATKPDGSYYWETVPHTGGKGYIAKMVLIWTLEDVDSGETRTYRVAGEGYDTTDKGTPKAITSSRKQAIILIANLPVGNDIEERGAVPREEAKAAAKAVGDAKVSKMAAAGSQAAVDAISQVVPESKIVISRPEEHNGNYIIVTGMIAVPQLERFFDDTGSKRFKTKTDLVPYWRVPAEYEKGLVLLCEKLKIEVEG